MRSDGREVKFVSKCAAKVNLCLKIIGKRPDGYHDLQSLITAVSLWDELTFEPAECFSLSLSVPWSTGHGMENEIPLDDRNTVYRAVKLIAESAGKPLNFVVRLKKSIPTRAGLGGGSSDGAAAILTLRRVWNLRWSWRKLVTLAVRIGADVPFFLVPTGAAIVEGIGDTLTPIKLPTLWIVLAKPKAEMSTQKAFALWDAKPVYVETDPNELVAALWRRDIEMVRRLVVNAFEYVIAARIPDVVELKQKLMAEGAIAAAMSGSGTTVFGVFFDREAAKRALEAVRPVTIWCQLTRTVRQSVIVQRGEGK